MNIRDQLKTLRACGKALEWVGDKALDEAWRECPRGDWMLWLTVRVGIEHKTLALAACDCAELADQYLCDYTRAPARHAIRVSRLWCDGKAGMRDVVHAADATALAAAAANAAGTAYATAYAAAAAANAARVAAGAGAATGAAAGAYAAEAAANATNAIAAGAARDAMHAECADIVRRHISVSMITKAMEQVK